MIGLRQFREYLESVVARVDALHAAEPLAVEANMADRVAKFKEEETPVLFFLPPSADGEGDADSFRETSLCVVFVMAKYLPRVKTSFEVLEETQPVAEEVKKLLVRDSAAPCHFLKLEHNTVSTLPETEFFGNWAGWSIAFKA